ncbi:MAG TPA: hypothetical protein VF988_09190 [Verrucomicrobiae bacterium]
MNATVNHQSQGAKADELVANCRILVLHEDYTTHTHALDLCRHVTEHFADDLEFEVKCWSVVELADVGCARLAAKSAAAADIVLLSLRTVELPEQLTAWLDRHFVARFKAEGMLALVVDRAEGTQAALVETQLQLHRLAERVGMNFFSFLPDRPAATASHSLPGLQPPGVLALIDDIADRPVLDHWGLNE